MKLVHDYVQKIMFGICYTYILLVIVIFCIRLAIRLLGNQFLSVGVKTYLVSFLIDSLVILVDLDRLFPEADEGNGLNCRKQWQKSINYVLSIYMHIYNIFVVIHLHYICASYLWMNLALLFSKVKYIIAMVMAWL